MSDPTLQVQSQGVGGNNRPLKGDSEAEVGTLQGHAGGQVGNREPGGRLPDGRTLL